MLIFKMLSQAFKLHVCLRVGSWGIDWDGDVQKLAGEWALSDPGLDGSEGGRTTRRRLDAQVGDWCQPPSEMWQRGICACPQALIRRQVWPAPQGSKVTSAGCRWRPGGPYLSALSRWHFQVGDLMDPSIDSRLCLFFACFPFSTIF